MEPWLQCRSISLPIPCTIIEISGVFSLEQMSSKATEMLSAREIEVQKERFRHAFPNHIRRKPCL